LTSELKSTNTEVHESCFKSYHIVEKIKNLCEQKVPHNVILEIIEDLKSNESKYFEDINNE